MRLSLLLSLFVLAGASPGAAQEPVAMDGGLKGVMYRPSGAGPFPAIVALHGCGGIGRNPEKPSRRHADWGERLAAAGFVVLFPDSFGSRGLGSQCNVRDRTVRPGRERVADAVVARRWLAGQPFVAGGDVNLLGWSNGGSVVINALAKGGGGFRRAVAFYPGCRLLAERGDWRAPIPTLILIGDADDWTPAAPCRDLAEQARRAGSDVTLVAYPGAYHNFDDPNEPVRVRSGVAYSAAGTGVVHQGTNPGARADALTRVPAFLRR